MQFKSASDRFELHAEEGRILEANFDSSPLRFPQVRLGHLQQLLVGGGVDVPADSPLRFFHDELGHNRLPIRQDSVDNPVAKWVGEQECIVFFGRDIGAIGGEEFLPEAENRRHDRLCVGLDGDEQLEEVFAGQALADDEFPDPVEKELVVLFDDAEWAG